MILGSEPLTEPVAALTTAILIEGCTAVDIVGNNMRAVSVGVHGDNSGAVRVCDNTIIVDGRIYTIDVAASDCVIRDNTVEHADHTHGGIRGTGTHTRIEGNRLLSNTRAQDHLIPLGIFLGPRSAENDLPHHGAIQGNVLTGQQDGIVVIGRHVRELENVHVYDNRVENSRLAVALKHTHGARVLRNHLSNGEYGVAVSGKIEQSNIGVLENVIENMQGAGLAVGNLAEATITHNRIAWCGYERETISINIDPLGPVISTDMSAALFVIVGSALRLESNEILETGISRDRRATTSAAVGMVVVAQRCQIESNRVAYSDIIPPLDMAQEHRALFLLSFNALRLNAEAQSGHATIEDNSFSGAGIPHLVELHQPSNSHRSGFEKIIFSNNHCDHASATSGEAPLASGAATVSLWGEHLIVMGNQVKATSSDIPSMNFNGLREVALMGNMTTGVFVNLGSSVPRNRANFNIRV